MRIINLNESQYKRLFETNGQPSSFVQTAGSGVALDSTPGGTGDEVHASALITGKDGNLKFSRPPGAMGKDPHATDFSPTGDRKGRAGRPSV